ncbi:L-2-hydroxyglutarate oxidase [bacterium]|nr:L-2-hydroxyglutarate oxidase [candidate division CSSED10-310 bacterium]
MTADFDTMVVGGGIVGMATAWHLLRRQPGSRLILLEREQTLAAHQTGNNSGVIHSGLYYKPGSLKARNCVHGREMLYAFCSEHDIPFERCGKLVVAVNAAEIPRLDALHARGVANGLQGMKQMSSQEMKEIEPHCAGVRGLWIQETGIVDYTRVVAALATAVTNQGGEIRMGTTFLGLHHRDGRQWVETSEGDIPVRCLINCAGLYSDRVARLSGVIPDVKIMPFRGEYYTVKPEKAYLINHLIYPVPDPQFPFLGVHFTRMINGTREAGPNAVLAFKREGYQKTDFSVNDVLDCAMYPGFWRMARCHWRMGFGEFVRSFSKLAFVRALQKLIPEMTGEDIQPGGAGVRAQALESSGFLVDDFRIIQTRNQVHVLNAPSPAATAGLSIGGIIADRVTM